MNTCITSLVVIALLLAPERGQAQSIELGVQVVGSQWSEFKGTDLGIGGRVTWKPAPIVGIEAEATWYPRAFPKNGLAFSGNRFEGVVAVTAGPRLGRVRPFVRAGAGFLKSTEAPQPFACIAIFPPPLVCLMAAGQTMPVFDLGGGVEVSTSQATFLRFDASDRILKYPGPTFGPADEVRNDGFFGHGFRFSFGAGWRF